MRHCHVILVVFHLALLAKGAVVRNEDICAAQNGRRFYLELGDQGILYAKNVSFIKNEPRLQASRIYSNNSSHDHCSLDLVTCPSCVISLTFKSISLSQNCGDGKFMFDNPCRCDYVWVSEPPYEDVSGSPFCGFHPPITYRSNTRTLSINLLYSQSHDHAFTLEYTAERNRIHLKGIDISAAMGKSRNSTSSGILTSPFFPACYPRDLGMEYIITCPAESPACRVRVLFSDFQLASVSIIEFYDWNGQRLDVSSGVIFRPPIIVSAGPSLLIRFYANGGTGLGYKAFYSFVHGHLYDKSLQPITDCGGYVENLGGAITMIDMTDEGVKIYDCVWLIRPPKTYLHMKTHIYIKVITFDDMAGNTELVVKQGPTSALLPLEILRHPVSQLQPRRLKEHIAPISSGFHVTLRGVFGPTSHLAMAYAAFSYTDCFTETDFLCENHRCIPIQLSCDGFDHCGDNSDEPATCTQNWDLEPQDRKWQINKANYYFPKIDRYPDLKTATLVFVASSLGLITLISALIILLYRMGKRARQNRDLQSRLQTISELLGSTVFDLADDGSRVEQPMSPDDPPVYEYPPGYDEVVKVGMENERLKLRKSKFNSSCRRSRSCNNQFSGGCEGQSVGIFPDGAGTSRSYQSISVLDSSVQRTATPPPPYVTPPGTISKYMNLHIQSYSAECADNFNNHSDRTRCGEIENSEEHLKTIIVSETADPGLTSSPDAETLGTYLQNYGANSSENSAPQLNNWKDASMDINPEFVKKSKNAEEIVNVAENRNNMTLLTEEASGSANNSEDPGSSNLGPETSASQNKKPRSMKLRKKSVPSTSSSIFKANSSSNSAAVSPTSLAIAAASSTASSPEDTSSSLLPTAPSSDNKTVTSKLFGNSKIVNKSHQSMTLNSNNFATVSPSLCGPFGKSFRRNGLSRKFSICSYDSYATKISALSTSSSYERLHDDFDIVSEACSVISLNTRMNTPISTPRIIKKRHMPLAKPSSSRHTNCDIESLYEGIRIFDSFLAKNGMNSVNSSKNLSIVTLFGTPRYSKKRVPKARDSEHELERKRCWRSTGDILF
ncbi:uncharacterized protein LOC117175714 isoform X2 [Belonocnema kinseyi]|uniref:uncharacterized protein LOC117175714 isoform X2 n=1 Tax=Belonocnema kinseyi TaxID=2817044 RepID=UPI00143DDFD3|nr:uncharacterized protein LOC117175714 isoform X2 [Belonocnema kinseyi]